MYFVQMEDFRQLQDQLTAQREHTESALLSQLQADAERFIFDAGNIPIIFRNC